MSIDGGSSLGLTLTPCSLYCLKVLKLASKRDVEKNTSFSLISHDVRFENKFS